MVEASLKILPDAPVSPCGGDLRILIAEDNFVNQRVIFKCDFQAKKHNLLTLSCFPGVVKASEGIGI